MSKRGKTLAEWDAKKGDVFYFNGNSMRGSDRVFDHFCKTGGFHALDNEGVSMVDSSYWHLVSRATPEPDYNDGKWHTWSGDRRCPVDYMTTIDQVWHDENHGTSGIHKERIAGGASWEQTLKFRVVTPYVEPKEPREFKLYIRGDHGVTWYDGNPSEEIHVREVLDQ